MDKFILKKKKLPKNINNLGLLKLKLIIVENEKNIKLFLKNKILYLIRMNI